MDAPAETLLRPVASKVVAPDAVPRELSEAANGLLVRVLAGSFRGSADALGVAAGPPVLLLHVRVEPGADGVLGPLPAEFNGFVWVLEGAVQVGGDDAADSEPPVHAEHSADKGLVLLPPGGVSLRVRHGGGDAAAQLFVALGRPHRKPYCKYVGYGGGLIHRSVEEAMAAMAEYEADPTGYGRVAAGAGARPVDLGAYELVDGFQSNGGEMMERPAGVVARFKYKE